VIVETDKEALEEVAVIKPEIGSIDAVAGTVLVHVPPAGVELTVIVSK
jgi:hypothetical protein